MYQRLHVSCTFTEIRLYRLDRIHKSTGLDLRVFEDAITFKIALMVVRYMKYMETLEY